MTCPFDCEDLLKDGFYPRSYGLANLVIKKEFERFIKNSKINIATLKEDFEDWLAFESSFFIIDTREVEKETLLVV